MAAPRLTQEEKRVRKAASSKKWRDKNKHRQPAYKLKYKYGMTMEQYDDMLSAQGHSCAICRTPDPGSRGKFFVDHNHTTGAVRGLLCHQCNTAIGLFKDNTASLLRAVEYIQCSETIH